MQPEPPADTKMIINELQMELSNQLIQKEQIESEYWRIGNNSKNKQQLQKKI